MSDFFSVFINKEKAPPVELLLQWFETVGLIMDQEYAQSIADLEAFDGYWPGKYQSHQIGFEICAEPVDEEDLEDWEIDSQQLEGRDYLLSITFYELDDLLGAAIAAAAICLHADGLIFDEDPQALVSEKQAEQWKQSQLKSIEAVR